MGKLPFQEPWFSAQFVCKIWSWKHWRNRMFGRVPSPKTRHPCAKVANILQLPMNIRCPQRTICDRIEGLCMLLRRFSYPCRYSDMISRFGRPVPDLCTITNNDNIFNNHDHGISQWIDDALSPHLLQEYADVRHAKGAPLENCFGFIDGQWDRSLVPINSKGLFIMVTSVFTR